jgi:hypothetical protein
MALPQTKLWSFKTGPDRLISSLTANGARYSRASAEGNESSIPLLPNNMAEDKLKPHSQVVEAVGSDSESSGQDVALEDKKAPWWSYIWVNAVLVLSLDCV